MTILVIASLGPLAYLRLKTAPPSLPDHRIGVRLVNGLAEFYDKTTGANFVPRGNNYIRLAGTCLDASETPGPIYHSTFSPAHYNSTDVEQSLMGMSQEGYNLVRVFLNPGCMADSNGGIVPAYLQNVADFLMIARRSGIFVMITYDGPPQTCVDRFRYYDNIDYENLPFLTPEGVSAEVCFWQDFVGGLRNLSAPLENVFAYELRSEAQFAGDEQPFSLASGLVTTVNGKTYDMANATQKQQMMEENLVYWINHVRQGILDVDPTALVTIGFFPPGYGGVRLIATGLVFADPESGGSTADFVDLHMYLTGGSMSPQVASYDIANPARKPMIMGEFGAYKSNYSSTVGFGYYSSAASAGPALQDWQIESCSYGIGGWTLWTWDSNSQPEWWNALDAGGTISHFLSPQDRPDPCLPGTL